MTTCVVGRDRAEVGERVGRVLAVTGRDESVAEVVDARPNWLLGTVDQVAERLAALEAAGVGRVMLQHLDHADTEMVAVLGEVAATMGSAP
jgi:alkanesulfonate monooxygenase SsuD/methylene tetrahydromethanopterin reductase-like flavin-dependent oxidoreductase (luciferase family)